MIVKVNVYKSAGEWCYRADDENGFDHSDTLGCDDGATADQAQAEAAEQFPGASIHRVDDIQ